MTLKEIRKQIRETRKEMRAKGIKRISCFNGGLSGEVYSLNARMFSPCAVKCYDENTGLLSWHCPCYKFVNVNFSSEERGHSMSARTTYNRYIARLIREDLQTREDTLATVRLNETMTTAEVLDYVNDVDFATKALAAFARIGDIS